MKIHIKNGRLIDPKNGVDDKRDIFIAAGKIVADGDTPAGFAANRVIDATGRVVCPGLVDLAVRLREPGFILEGFERDSDLPLEEADRGYNLYTVRAWDYPALIETYLSAAEIAREYHIPSLVHVTEVTQPQGHSTSGSHERYKSPERMKFEEEFDCLRRMREWMIDNRVISDLELIALEKADYDAVEGIRKLAWDAYLAPIIEERNQVMDMLDEVGGSSSHASELERIKERLANLPSAARRDVHSAAHEALRVLRDEGNPSKQVLVQWKNEQDAINLERYGSHLHNGRAVAVKEVKPEYSASSPTVMGFEVMNAAFDVILGRDPRVIAFGEDVGFLGDVNQGFKGMQEKYGALRVTDTGIREATIKGQAIGMAMRGLRPICEIQYLDYILYALQIMSDSRIVALAYRGRAGVACDFVSVFTSLHREPKLPCNRPCVKMMKAL